MTFVFTSIWPTPDTVRESPPTSLSRRIKPAQCSARLAGDVIPMIGDNVRFAMFHLREPYLRLDGLGDLNGHER